ncbi:hypothetical protein PYJP_04000 [Pyrofollis japonicus]|uniref:ribbon-helix-helix domain-containing protein n=1 Tax=Pyrofollis japonicus TaxID=3060460 RepID=UPI00295B623C|nr:ribbon-helix-helix domain-containing protein [Pyrofollis japonicus]BEP17048.1 hypothetical protein PYJP_04000 [Pyrofollis japonicus]
MTRHLVVKIPEMFLEGLDELVSAGVYRNRSEAVRAAIRLLLERHGVLKRRVVGVA